MRRLPTLEELHQRRYPPAPVPPVDEHEDPIHWEDWVSLLGDRFEEKKT
jgi:hypothetical protein